MEEDEPFCFILDLYQRRPAPSPRPRRSFEEPVAHLLLPTEHAELIALRDEEICQDCLP